MAVICIRISEGHSVNQVKRKGFNSLTLAVYHVTHQRDVVLHIKYIVVVHTY